MPAVVISRSLRLVLGDVEARNLGTDFLDYKTGAANFGDVFGKDKLHTRPPEAVAHELQHVHMETPQVASVWDSLWKRRFAQEKFTSNKILVYGHMWDVAKAPWLLLFILNPDGHAKMEDDNVMRALAAEYGEEKDDYSRDPFRTEWIIIE